jgi:glycosyltransferase involved in cell wall biosynthesis
MKILVFSSFFPPEIGAAPMRIFEHASYWITEGHDVTIVTNVPNSPMGKIYEGYINRMFQEEAYCGIKVKRVFTVPAGKQMSKWRRAISFVASIFMYCLAAVKEPKPDVVIATAPYFTGIPGILASLWHSKPFIYEMRDPWLQVAAESRKMQANSVAHKILCAIERIVAKHAKNVVVIGREMASVIKQELHLVKPPEVISNGIKTDEQFISHDTARIPKLNGKFVIGMIGNMGVQYDFDVILEAATDLSKESCFFLFLGSGGQTDRLKEKSHQLKLKNVGFFPPVPPQEAILWMNSCNLTVVSMRLQSIFRMYLPKKVLDSLSIGVPVLFGGAGEVQKILDASGGGAYFPAGNKDTLVSLIRERLANKNICRSEGEKGKMYVQEHFDRKTMAQKYLGIMAA